MLFRQLFDNTSSTYTYLLADETTRRAILIDPVFEQAQRDMALLRELNLTLAPRRPCDSSLVIAGKDRLPDRLGKSDRCGARQSSSGGRAGFWC